MARTLLTGLAMASLLFAACGAPDDSSLDSAEAQLRRGHRCQGANCPTLLQAGDACGGLLGGRTACGEGTYCAYPIAVQCGAGDQQGVCTAQPPFCPRGIRYNPVCGCDSQTYDGGCNASIAGTSVQRTGACDYNVTGDWQYISGSHYHYSFDPDGTFTSSAQPGCVFTTPLCAIRVLDTVGVYQLTGRLLNLVYTSEFRKGQTVRFAIVGTDQAMHLTGTDNGVQLDLTRTR